MRNYLLLLTFLNFFCSAAFASTPDRDPEYKSKVKVTQAIRTTKAPVLDGYLEPEIWRMVQPATSFVRFDPLNGKPSSQQTEVLMLYDNEAVYIGALLHDTAPDSILTQLGQRDSGENNADMFGVYLDTYNDKQNAFAFMVSAAGVQTDVKISQDREDKNWDAVWASHTKLTPEGWVVEMRIPYGAIRFPKTEVQSWGVNFMRIIRRTREKSFWNHVNNAVEGFVNQGGKAEGIEGIKSPVRLQLTPYVSGYIDHFSGGGGISSNTSSSLNGGMDVKYGINDAFTLDVTLIPDFGQAQSDNQVLNLSPFEVRFSENRQFFTEGTELFNKAGLFYSRRIGGTPLLRDKIRNSLKQDEVLVTNPSESRLLNAAKVSGRTKKGLGIGLFNAITRNIFAEVQDTTTGEIREVITDPYTNYSVFVLDQTLPRNSYLTFTNTNVTRSQGYYDANVSGIQARFADKTNTYALKIGSNVSQLYNKVMPGDTMPTAVTLGHQYDINLSKISGNLQYGINHSVESDSYEINDLGFLRNPNEFNMGANISYNFFQPIWKFLSWGSSLSVRYNMLYAPREFTGTSINGSTHVRFRNFMSTYMRFGIRPSNAYDYFEARSFPQVFIKPPAFDTNIGISTDYRKRVALDASTGFWRSPEYDQLNLWGSLNPRFRVNDKFSLINNNNYSIEKRNIGYAGKDEFKHIMFGDRVVTTFTTTLSGAYIFNENTGLTLNMRHYWSRAEYQKYFELQPDGSLEAATTARNGDFSRKDINFNTFNLDLVYSWRFAPGSELRVVWKNFIRDQSDVIRGQYFDNVSQTFQAPQSNNFSVKLLYFIDYLSLKNVLSA